MLLREIYNPPRPATSRVAEVLHFQDPVPVDVHDLGTTPARNPLHLRPVEVHVPVQPQGGLVTVYEPQERLESYVGGVLVVPEAEGRGVGDEDLRIRTSEEAAAQNPRR